MRRLDAFFAITARGSTVPREILAGVTTFSAMSYILIVHPMIMAGAGLDRHAQTTITAWVAFAGTLLVALWPRMPLAVAPGMAANVLFAQVIVGQMSLSPAVGLAMLFISSSLFLLLAVSGLRQRLLLALPLAVRAGIQGGLGLLIAYIGLQNGGLVHATASGLHVAPLVQPAVIYTAVGLLVTAALFAAGTPGALLISILVMTAGGLFVPLPGGGFVTHLPSRLLDWPGLPDAYFFAMDFHGYLANLPVVLPLTLYYFLSEFFAAAGTIVAVAGRPPLSMTPGVVTEGHRLFLCDAFSELTSSVLGTSTAGVFLESSAGVESGGRTGFASVITAALFLLSLCLWPMLTAVPPQAIAPALVMIGLSMLRSLADVDMQRAEDWVPALLIILIMAVAGDFMVALTAGCLSYTLIMFFSRRHRDMSPVILLLDVMLTVDLILKVRLIPG